MARLSSPAAWLLLLVVCGAQGITAIREERDQHPTRGSSYRVQAVVAAARDAWLAYEKHALGSDELRPISKVGSNSLGGLAATVVESLDTLWLMGLREEYGRARAYVAANLTFDRPANISLFETIIRLHGGLMSAYDLTGDHLFLEKATHLADRLAPAFLVCPKSGIPQNAARLPVATGGSPEGLAVLAELGTATLEFGALSLRGGNHTYRRLAERPVRFIWRGANRKKGLYSDLVERCSGREASGRVTIGGGSDSTYEYLIKYWLLTGKQDDWWRKRWVRAMDDAVARLVRVSDDGALVWTSDLNTTDDTTSNYFEHLACFWPGNLVLGILSGAVHGQRAQRYAWVAEHVTEACYQLYSRSPTLLSWDMVHVETTNGAFTMHPTAGRNYLQRPEVLESIFHMWLLTADSKYQEWGWHIFMAMQRVAKVPNGGFTGLLDAGKVPPTPDDFQQSWLMAETFKYLWLLFASSSRAEGSGGALQAGSGGLRLLQRSALDLEQWVLTTEAHPLRVQRAWAAGVHPGGAVAGREQSLV